MSSYDGHAWSPKEWIAGAETDDALSLAISAVYTDVLSSRRLALVLVQGCSY